MDNVLEHIPSQRADAVIDEVLRVLKPGGTLLIGVPGRKGYAADPDHKCFYGESDLEQLMSAHGCRMRKLIHMPIGGAFADKHLTQYCIYAAFAKSMRGSPT
jgi:SAM-dependent methyltransferase